MKRCLLALALTLAPLVANAGTTGSLAGIVTDAAGHPVADANIAMASPSTLMTTRTDAAGHYCFVSLPPDTYTLTIRKDGLAPVILPDLLVFADVHRHLALTAGRPLTAIAVIREYHPFGTVSFGRFSDVYGYFDASEFPAPPNDFNDWLLRLTPGVTFGIAATAVR